VTVYYDFDEVDAFTVTAVGAPGSRTFFLQVRRGDTWVTVKCEKMQTAAMASHIRKVLDDLPDSLPREVLPLASEMEPLGPLEAAFVLGPIGLGYDREHDRVMVQLEEFSIIDDDELDLPDDVEAEASTVRAFLTRAQATAFCARTEQIVAAGRPPCRWCGGPVDPDGHPCPRMN